MASSLRRQSPGPSGLRVQRGPARLRAVGGKERVWAVSPPVALRARHRVGPTLVHLEGEGAFIITPSVRCWLSAFNIPAVPLHDY